MNHIELNKSALLPCMKGKNIFLRHSICCYVSSTISSLILTSGFLTDDMH